MLLGSDPNDPNSIHAAVAIIDSNGVVIGQVPGDYVAFVELLRGGPSGMGTGVVTRVQAARFLQQATFGPTSRDLDRVRQLGYAGWIDEQITNRAPTFHRAYIEQLYANFAAGRTDHSYYAGINDAGDLVIGGQNCMTSFARGAITGPDQLRQRVAFALSQIIVVSRADPAVGPRPRAAMDFYDIFVRNAFGNYYDILRQAAFHPVMGLYLTHVGNEKARPEINQYPDENFAREVMQLFSIGLWELNPDGTRRLDIYGQPIPTFHNADITELARVFTGLWFAGQTWGVGGNFDADRQRPCKCGRSGMISGGKTLSRLCHSRARAIG